MGENSKLGNCNLFVQWKHASNSKLRIQFWWWAMESLVELWFMLFITNKAYLYFIKIYLYIVLCLRETSARRWNLGLKLKEFILFESKKNKQITKLPACIKKLKSCKTL